MLGAVPAAAADVLVFAAASLKNALDDATAAYRQQGGDVVRISYAATAGLLGQRGAFGIGDADHLAPPLPRGRGPRAQRLLVARRCADEENPPPRGTRPPHQA